LLAFEEIYRQHIDLVYNMALHYVRNVEEAEEITQDVFVKVYFNLSKYRFEADLKTWIYRITINASLDSIRKSKRGRSIFISWSEDEVSEKSLISDFKNPLSELVNQEALNGLLNKIDQLPNNQKSVVLLMKMEFLTQKEVAKILEISEKAVESLFQRAKENLKKMI